MQKPLKTFLLALFLLFISSPLIAQQKKTITAKNIVDLQVVRDVQISPDGTHIAFSAGKRYEFDQLRESRIWIVPSDASAPPKQLVQSQQSQTSPRWSSDGKFIAFLSGTKDSESNQIWLLDLKNSKTRMVTTIKNGVDSFQWSPDNNWIAFASTDSKTEEEERKEKNKDDAVLVDRNYKFARLYSLNVSDGSMRRLFQEAGNVNDYDWSRNGDHLAVKISPSPLLDDVFWRSKLLVISSKTGEVKRILDQQAGSWVKVRWSPDGQNIAYTKLTPNGIAEWRMLASVDGANIRQIDDEYNGTLLAMEWFPDSNHLLAVGIEGTRTKFLKIDGKNSHIVPLTDFQAPYGDFTISADGRKIAFVGEQSDSPANVWVWEMDGQPRRITNFQPEVASWSTGNVREITWKNPRDNTLLYGVLITPPNFQQDHPYPTIVQIHGGPEWMWWSGWHGSWHEWGQILASNGYVVFLPNPRGSDGQNWRFIEANMEDWGGMDYEDILSGIDDLILKKIADPERLGIGGWSYGGYMTAWAVTHSDRFQAAVVGAAVTNLFSMSGTGDIPTFLNNYFKGTPFDQRSKYDAHSPISFLQNCKTPSLVLHGEADPRVPLSQGLEFYNGLKMMGRTSEMVIYPREPHGFKEEMHQQDLLQRVLDWYNKYLK